jgi:hypothetical protein
MACLRILMLLAVVAFVGCQANEAEKVDVQATPAADAAKAALNEIAESGQLGSGMMIVRESVEEANAELVPEVDALETLTDEAAIKAKAKEIAGKL